MKLVKSKSFELYKPDPEIQKALRELDVIAKRIWQKHKAEMLVGNENWRALVAARKVDVDLRLPRAVMAFEEKQDKADSLQVGIHRNGGGK